MSEYLAHVERHAKAHAQAYVREELLRKVLEEAIRAAHNDGATLRSIAEAAGISHQRVHQIIQKGQS